MGGAPFCCKAARVSEDSFHWNVLRDLLHVLKSDMLKQGHTAGDVREPEAGGIAAGVPWRTTLHTKGTNFGHWLFRRFAVCIISLPVHTKQSFARLE